MRKRFILLIDFSEYSNNLIKYAIDWSKEVNPEILLFHQTIILSPALADSEAKQQIIDFSNNEALQKLQALAQSIIPNTMRVSYLVSEKPLHISLSELIAEPFENLIFVGVKGTGVLKKIFLGSVAVQAIKKTRNIIVAMPKEINTFSHEKIFVAINEKEPLNTVELNNFLKFIDNENTHITFFYLAKPKENTNHIEKELQQLAEMFADRFTTDIAIYEGQNRLEDIKKVINNNIDELLVIQKGSRYFTDQFFQRFIINELVYDGQTPLIVLP
ncbi:MAG TPA: universal stress protein [Chitinophagales bacterium]|nr:universal stress protein [Chitinophagales bacterium]